MRKKGKSNETTCMILPSKGYAADKKKRKNSMVRRVLMILVAVFILMGGWLFS